MQSVCSSRLRQAALAATLLVAAIGPTPVEALDLFARHQVTVQFSASDGKPMANAEVRVFAPGEPNRPALTGRTDNEGKFEFGADRDGFWSAEARSGGEVARASVRVGGEQQKRAAERGAAVAVLAFRCAPDAAGDRRMVSAAARQSPPILTYFVIP